MNNLLVVGILMVLIGILVIYLDIKNRPNDNQIDDWIEEDLEEARKKSLFKLSIDESEIIFEEKIIITGPRYERTGGADFKFKIGKDKQLRFTPIDVFVINLTDNQFMTYQCCLDILTGNLLSESTDEYFYKDIVTVGTKTSSYTMKFDKPVKLPNGQLETQRQVNDGEKFVLTTSGGTSTEVLLRDQSMEKEVGYTYKINDAEKVIQNIRKMLREKKASA